MKRNLVSTTGKKSDHVFHESSSVGGEEWEISTLTHLFAKIKLRLRFPSKKHIKERP